MKISVDVKLKSKIEEVTQLETGSFLVKTRAAPIDGKANQRIIELLSDFMNIPKSKFELYQVNAVRKKYLKFPKIDSCLIFMRGVEEEYETKNSQFTSYVCVWGCLGSKYITRTYSRWDHQPSNTARSRIESGEQKPLSELIKKKKRKPKTDVTAEPPQSETSAIPPAAQTPQDGSKTSTPTKN